MKHIVQRAGTVLLALGLLSTSALAAGLTEGMKEGKAACKSMGPLAFGPAGILFIADTKSAAVVAIATGDTTPASARQPGKAKLRRLE